MPPAPGEREWLRVHAYLQARRFELAVRAADRPSCPPFVDNRKTRIYYRRHAR